MQQYLLSRNDERASTASKKLIIMCGYPGVGKTTTAHRIRHATDDCIVISRDYFRNQYQVSSHIDEYSNWRATLIDRTFFAHAEQLLSVYTTVVLDATFREWSKRQMAFDFAQKHGCQFFIIECVCSYPVLLQRLRRQLFLGYKKFIKTPEEVLKYYFTSMQEPENKLSGVSLLKLNTEENQIILKSLQNSCCYFAMQLIEALERPFDPILFESFPKFFFQESTLMQKFSSFDVTLTKAEKHFSL